MDMGGRVAILNKLQQQVSPRVPAYVRRTTNIDFSSVVAATDLLFRLTIHTHYTHTCLSPVIEVPPPNSLGCCCGGGPLPLDEQTATTTTVRMRFCLAYI